MTKSYFDNIQEVIANHIASASNEIYVAVAWFTNDVLFENLLDALKRKVKVNVLITDDILNRNEFGLDFGKLADNGAVINFANLSNGTMHNKFCIVDNKVITGSYNWTYHANKNNENILVTDEESLVKAYVEEFEKLFGKGIPIPQPYEHLKWTDVKEGDFSELRRNIFRDIVAQNDYNSELKKIKLKKLNHAYKSGNSEELAKASSFTTEQHLRTIIDVLTSRSQDYTYRLWEENKVGKPLDNVDGFVTIGKWFFDPYNTIREDNSHKEYVEGQLFPYTFDELSGGFGRGYKLKVFDYKFINEIRKFVDVETGYIQKKLIPKEILIIEKAKMFYYQFPSPMFNKSQPRICYNTMPRTILAINLLGIVKEVDGDTVVFYDGWEPQERGEKIMKEFFIK